MLIRGNNLTSGESYIFDSMAQAVEMTRVPFRCITDCVATGLPYDCFTRLPAECGNQFDKWMFEKCKRPKVIKRKVVHLPVPSKAVKATNLKTGEEFIFDSLRECSRHLGIPCGNISKVCSGKRLTAGGYKFKILQE